MNTSLTGRVEAVQRKALNVVDWRFRSPTSSEHPYRSFATSMRRAFPPLPLLLLTLFSFRRFATNVAAQGRRRSFYPLDFASFARKESSRTSSDREALLQSSPSP